VVEKKEGEHPKRGGQVGAYLAEGEGRGAKVGGRRGGGSPPEEEGGGESGRGKSDSGHGGLGKEE